MTFSAVIIDDLAKDVKTLAALIEEYTPVVNVVGTASDIDAGYEMVREKKPEIVFLDIHMPRGDGFDFLERFPVRKFDIIIITADENLRGKAKEYQSFEIVIKPIEIEKFVSIIERVIKFRIENPNRIYNRFPK